MTSLETIFYDFMNSNNLTYLLFSYEKLIKSKKLRGQSFKVLKGFVNSGKVENFKQQLISYFKRYNIAYVSKSEYLSKHRQKAFRSKQSLAGYKRIDFYLDPDSYDLFVSLRAKKTNRDFMKSLLANYCK